MNWSTIFQMAFLVLVGAWIHSRGGKSASIIPGEETVRELAAAVSGRIRGNGRKIPVDLPRITS